ncbi:MAG TPA: hypothetical protein VMY76_04320 [Gemmatimonadales bacterium]|nr:hypothetical protein [Gemmatimonadales bacterium]
MTDPRTAILESRRIAAIWAGLLLAPAAFLVNLELGYLVVRPSCLQGSVLPVHLVHLATMVLALLGALVAWRTWRLEGATWPGDAGGPPARTRFMGGLGLVTSALFVLTMLAQWIPSFVLHPCQ